MAEPPIFGELFFILRTHCDTSLKPNVCPSYRNRIKILRCRPQFHLYKYPNDFCSLQDVKIYRKLQRSKLYYFLTRVILKMQPALDAYIQFVFLLEKCHKCHNLFSEGGHENAKKQIAFSSATEKRKKTFTAFLSFIFAVGAT